MDQRTQDSLDYSLILLHDVMKLPMTKIGNVELVELFIRSSLKVPSLTRLCEYFTTYLPGKSAICDKPKKYKCRDWIVFHNQLRLRKGYEELVPFSHKQRNSIKDKRYVMYKILSYEVKHGINGLQKFDFFTRKRFLFHSPSVPSTFVDATTTTSQLTSPEFQLRDTLPSMKSNKAASGSDFEDSVSLAKAEKYSLCDNFGLNELMRETTLHAQCGCVGKLTHALGRSFFKPGLSVECSAHGAGCNIGRSKVINLTHACRLNYREKDYQCSLAATTLVGSVFSNGLNTTQFKRALTRSGFTVSNNRIEGVIRAYTHAVHEEYHDQQIRIDKTLKGKTNIRVGIDISFSQVRKASFSQTACLEQASGEIVRMVVLNKHIENCSSNKLEVLGVEKLIDLSHEAKIPLSLISTDESGEVANLLKKKSKTQNEIFGIKIVAQNDAFHKLKNSRKARKNKFQDPKFLSQKLLTKLEDLKLEGLKQMAKQMEVHYDSKRNIKKKNWSIC